MCCTLAKILLLPNYATHYTESLKQKNMPQLAERVHQLFDELFWPVLLTQLCTLECIRLRVYDENGDNLIIPLTLMSIGGVWALNKIKKLYDLIHLRGCAVSQ